MGPILLIDSLCLAKRARLVSVALSEKGISRTSETQAGARLLEILDGPSDTATKFGIKEQKLGVRLVASKQGMMHTVIFDPSIVQRSLRGSREEVREI